MSPSIILTGGRGTKDESSIEIITSDSRTKLQLPNLPYKDANHSIFNHDGTLIVVMSGVYSGESVYVAE